MDRTYHKFELIDDDGSYYCKSYRDGSVKDFTTFKDVVYIKKGGNAYDDKEQRGTIEIPNQRIKSIHGGTVMLSER